MKKDKMLKGRQACNTGLENKPKSPTWLRDGKEVCFV